ncbi:putative repeat protein (TIGR01451 family), partial [Flavobacterium arsenatis]
MKRLLLLLVFMLATVAGFAQADVVVTNTNNQNLYVAGTSVVYTVTVKNNGPEVATGVQVTYTNLNAIGGGGASSSWSGNGSSGTNPTFDNAIFVNTIPTLAVGETVVYTVTVNLPAWVVGALQTVANVTTTSTDPNTTNNQASDSDLQATTGADVVVTNTDNEVYYFTGSSSLYVITVKNNGPQVAQNIHFMNAKPSGVEIATWYSSRNNGAGTITTGASGSGNISNEVAELAVGASITYYFTVNVPNVYVGTLASIANVTTTSNDPIPENNTNITDFNVKAVNADVKISITNNQTIYTPGGNTSYTVVVKNDGPLAAANVNVASVFPAGITPTNWSGTNASTGTGELVNVIASLPSGSSVTYTVNVQIPGTFTGDLAAQVSATSTTADPNLTNNTATDTDAQISGANIVVTNTNGQTTYAVGTTTEYTITVTNQGPQVATNVNVFNAMPNGVTAATWSGNNSSAGTGNLQDVIPTLAVGASVIYTFNVDIPSNYLGNLKSETVISGPTFDPFPTCTNCIDIDTPSVTTNANVAVTITDGQSSYVANQTLTYTATVVNNGPSVANDVHVVVPVPTGITNFTWTGTNGSSGTNVGLNNTIPTLANGQSVTYTIVILVPPGFTGNLVNQISATSATNDPVLANNSAIDMDTPALTGADIKVVNTNNTNYFVPGANSTYIVTVTNQGPQTAYLVTPNVTFSPGVTLVSWSGSNGSTGTTLPVTNTIPEMSVGQVVTYTIIVNIPAGQTANVVSTATATLQTPSDPNFPNPSVDTDVLVQSDIAVTNTTVSDGYTLGQDIVYTVTVTNNGPNPATNVVVENLIPAGITDFSWTGPNSSSGTNVPVNNTIPTLASGASETYTITIEVPATFTGNLVTTANTTVSAGDTVPANNQATVTTPWGQYDISVTNTNGQTVYTPGAISNYTVTVTNNGPNPATNVVVQNLIPAGITSFSWTGPNASFGNDVALNHTIPTLAIGESVVYNITLTVPAGFTGDLVSEASAAIAGDLNLSNNTAIDKDVEAIISDVAIAITDNKTEYSPGISATYTVTVTNIGTVDASNIPVSSIVPADVTNYTWSGNGATGTGALNNTILSLAGGAFVTYTISFYVPATFTGNLVNEVSIVNPDTDASNNTSIDTNVPSAGANLVVVNTDSQPSYVPGQSRTYTIQITNYGPQVAQNVVVQNPVPAGINASTVSWSGNATSGTGALQNTIPTLAVGQTVTYTFVVPVPSNFPQNVNLVSEVTVTSDTIDPNPGCTQCVDVDTPTPFADLAVTKSDNRDTFLLSNNNTTPPEVEYVTYLITVVNNGPSDAMNVVVQDPMPNGINNVASVVWDASNGTNGTGSINQTIPTLTAGQIITYTVSIRMPTSFNSFTGNLVNVVNVSSSTPDNVSNNNSATDIDFPSTNHITIEAGKHNAALPVFNVKQLIRDILINEPCVNISNFTSSANSAQYGYFHRGNTNFPIKEGIILTSGNINTLDSKYTTGSSKQWGNYTPDPDLQMVMTAGGQTNQNRDASFVKFDFVPMGSEFSFNFLFSSQEYGQWQCSGFYDSFAFILTNLEDDTWENLAVVPVTGDMISVTKIRKGIYNNNCGDLNPTYFDKYNAGDGAGGSNQSNVEASHINIKGQTIRMKAATTVIAGKPYSIKLVVADASDDQLDTAVFIEAGSFNIGGPKITGTDLYADDEDFSGSNAICEGTTRIIRAATEANSDINYVWYRDDVIIPGANQHFIEVSEPGVYKVVFNYITMNCSQSDFIVVEFAPSPFDVDEAEDLYICDATPLFDLTQNKAIVLADFVQEDFTAQYYHSKEDAELGINRIGSETPPVSLTQYPGVDGETIYIKVINDFSGGYCDPIKPFQLFLTSSPSGGFSYPDDGGDPGFCIGSSTSLLPIAPGLTPGGVYTSTPPGLTIVDPATGEINVSTSLEGTYTVIYTFTGMGCPEYTSPPVQVIISPCIATIAANSGPVCEGTATFNLTATDAGAGATYEWKDYNGNVISNVQNPTGIPVPATDGTYPYSVVATVGTSVSAPSITTLIVHPTPEADFVTPASNSICTGGQATIEVTGTPNSTVNVAVVDATSNYSAAVVLNSTGIGIFGISGVTEDTTFSLVNIVTNTTPACEFIFSPSPSVVFTVGLPTATMVGFDDPVICLGTTGSFKIQGTPGATVTYTIDTANPTDVLLPPSGEFDVVTAIQNVAGTYTYELTNIETTGTAGCSNAISGQTAILTVNALPTASFSTTTPTVCQNTPATINFTGPQGATVTYTDQTGTNYSVPLDASGSYVLTTDNLPDPQQSYTFTLVSVEETS